MVPTGVSGERATLTADDLITGEAVALDLPAAAVPIRLVSGGLDVLVTVVLLVGLLLVSLVASLPGGEAIGAAAYVGTVVLVFVAIPTTVETLTRGRSLGKLVTGLRTVRDDGGPISAQHALVRSLVGFVEIYVFSGVPALLSAILSTRGKRLGDYAAGTYVIRERARLRLPLPPAMPPALASWATTADMTSLPPGLTLAVRQYLGRAATLTPQARATVGPQLATEVSPYVAPPPPPGTSAEDFLAAVVASRRDRDHARLQREDALRRRLTSRA